MASNWALDINGGDDEDEALRRAIAMSLGQDLSAADLGRGEGDPERDETETPHLEAVERRTAPVVAPQSSKQSKAADPPPPAVSSLSALGLDRKAMEEERLARLKKRKAEPSAALESQPARQKLKSSANAPQSAYATPQAPAHQTKPYAEEPGLSGPSRNPTNTSSDLPFPQGVVKRTWVSGQPRLGDDIKVEEVLQKNELELAVLSSFQWDEDWLMSKFDFTKTKLVLIAYAADEAQREAMRSNVPASVIRFCFPPMQVAGAMHSKLQLLKFPDYLRIVVPTGNFVPYDWGETGVMENMVFLIDLPRIGDAAKAANNTLTPFGLELSYFLRAQGMDEKLIGSLGKYDFSATARYGFIHTIAGSHVQPAWKRTGYCGLGRTVNAMGLGTDDLVDIDLVCSSVGSVKDSLLTALYNACQGDSGIKEYNARTANSAKVKTNKDSKPMVEMSSNVKARFRVYFPSQDTVLQSRGGKDSAGTLSLLSRWWNLSSFPRDVFRDCKSTRPGLLMHSKAIFVRNRGCATGWAYVGSANLAESAWGRLVKDRGSGNPRLTCRNWECGVLIPASRGGNGLVGGVAGDDSLPSIFCDHVPIPMELPGSPYRAGGTTPWFSNP